MTPSPLKVCFLIDRLYPGGTESQLLALIRHLDRSRVLPHLALLDGNDPISRALEPDDCPVLRLGITSLHRPRVALQAWRFGRFLRRTRVDVVQTYFPDSTYFGTAVALLARVPRLVRTRFNLGYWMTGVHRRLERFVGRRVHATVTNCEPVRQSILDTEGGPQSRVVVLENGVDTHRFAAVPALDPARPPRRVGMVANLRPVKNPQLFLEAAACLAEAHPRVEFHLAGDGELRAGLLEQVRARGLADRVFLPGSVKDMPAFLGQLDVAVLCSQSEGLSNAVLEYMAAGRGIVATDVGANGQLIDHGTTGLLVPANDLESLTRALDTLLCDPVRAARLGDAARRRVRERFSLEARARRFEAFYERLMTAAVSEGNPNRDPATAPCLVPSTDNNIRMHP